ncbi:MAG: helix-turn-helix domain-containing protein [Moorellaceae bacterium]
MQKTLIIDSPTLKQGFTAAPNAVLYESRLSVQARWLYCILLSFAWQENECWPGQERIAEVAGWHVNTVEKYLKELRDFGLISWKRQGLNRPNIYYIHDPSKALGLKDSQASVNLDSHARVNKEDSINNINNVVVVYNNPSQDTLVTSAIQQPEEEANSCPQEDLPAPQIEKHSVAQPGEVNAGATRPDSETALQIQEAFTKIAGRALDDKALEELISYPLEYVLAKIAMAEVGKDKTNAIGWLLEACRENYQHLPLKAKKKRSGRKSSPAPKLPDTSKDDKYRDLYRLV